MPTVEKVVNFTYANVNKVKLVEIGTENYKLMNRVLGSVNTYRCKIEENDSTVYDGIEICRDDNVLAYVKDISVDNSIRTLYFKYNILDSEITFDISEYKLDIDDQYINDYGHNKNYVIDNSGLKHFDLDCTMTEIKNGEDEPPAISYDAQECNIAFEPTSQNFKLDAKLLLNTLSFYFTGNNLVISGLYKNDSGYYYLIKNSGPTLRNRMIKLTDSLIEEYENSKVFQLVEVFDNIVICTGKNLHTYNISNAGYVPSFIEDGDTRDNNDSYSDIIFDLNNRNVIESNINSTITSENVENQYAYYLPMDIDYCRLFFAVKLNTYNCYEFHTGNLLASYNTLEEEDHQVHYIHGVDTKKSTLASSEFKNENNDEGTEYGSIHRSLINDTSPYTNYDSYEISNEVQVLNDIGKLERYLICELQLNLKHAINCVTNHGDLLGKFSHFRLLESGVCKITKSYSGDLVLVIYSNLMTNLKKYIFKLSYSTEPNTAIKYENFDVENFYIQLSNDNLTISYLDSSNSWVGASINLVNINDSSFTNGNLVLTNGLDYIEMLYKNASIKVDKSLDIKE